MKRRRTRLELVEDRPVRLHRTRFDDERNLAPIQPLTERQAEYLDALAVNKQVIVLGPAGTGKTYIAGTRAADQLRQRDGQKFFRTVAHSAATARDSKTCSAHHSAKPASVFAARA